MDSHFGGIGKCHSRRLDRIQGRRIVSEEKEPINPTKAVNRAAELGCYDEILGV
jgi:hypothetical protein